MCVIYCYSVCLTSVQFSVTVFMILRCQLFSVLYFPCVVVLTKIRGPNLINNTSEKSRILSYCHFTCAAPTVTYLFFCCVEDCFGSCTSVCSMVVLSLKSSSPLIQMLFHSCSTSCYTYFSRIASCGNIHCVCVLP